MCLQGSRATLSSSWRAANQYRDRLSPAERLPHTLVWFRRLAIVSKAGLFLKGVRQHCQEFVERRKVVAFGRRLDNGLNTMVPWNEGGIY